VRGLEAKTNESMDSFSWVGHVARMRGKRGIYRDMVGKPMGKRPLGRPMRR